MKEATIERFAELPGMRQAPPPASDATVPVLVLEIGGIAFTHVYIGVIRSLGRMGVPVYAVVEDRLTPAAVSGYLAGAFVWETRGLDAHALLEGMAMIGRRLNRPTVVIPTGDDAAIFLAEHAATLREWFVLPKQPATLPRTLANKRQLYLLCKSIGVACPKTVFPGSIDDVREFVEHATFPIVVKPAEKWLLPAGMRHTPLIAQTPEQAYAIYRRAQRQPSANLILQEYIAPDDGEDWFYHGYRNMRTNCCIGFTGRKLRSYPPFAGPTTLGMAAVNDPLRQQAESLLDAVSYCGISDLDYRFDKRDGQYKLLDFNPRIGAQFRLFADRAGLDVARALYLDLTGRRVPSPRPIKDRTFVVEFYDLAASLGYFRQGRLTFREWRRSLKGTKERAWFSRDDLLPFLMICIRRLFRAAQKILPRRPARGIASRLPRYVRGRSKCSTRRTLKVARAIGAELPSSQ